MKIKEILTTELLNLINDGDVRTYIISKGVSLMSNICGYITHDGKEYLLDLGDEDFTAESHLDPVIINEDAEINFNGTKNNSVIVKAQADKDVTEVIISFYKIVPFDLGDRQKEPALV